MEQHSEIYASADQKLHQLKAILHLLQSNLDEFKDEVSRSYELSKIGEMTVLAKKIEDALTDPPDNISGLSSEQSGEASHRPIREVVFQAT